MQEEGTLHFPDLGEVTIDQVQIKIKNEKKLTYIFDIFNISNIFIFQKNQERAETFGLMTVSQDGVRLECEFRHLSLAEYLTALHVHVTGDNLLGKKYLRFVKLLQA